MYVRREIRSLSEEDREAFLSSALTLWTVGDEEGKAKFGSEQYRSVSFLLKYHHFNAGQQKTDHIHNGNGNGIRQIFYVLKLISTVVYPQLIVNFIYLIT